MVLTGIISSKAQTPCDEPLYLKATTSLCTNPKKVVIDNFDPNFAANYSWSFSIPPASVNYNANNSVAVIDWSNNTLVCNNNNANPFAVVTYNDGTCFMSDTVFFQCCCDRGYDVLLEDMEINQNTIYTNVTGTILIRGTIYLTDNAVLVFENCPNILAGPGARIIVETGEVVYINSHIRQGCGYMWQGHVLLGPAETQGTGIKFIDGSIAEDAMFLVEARNQAAVKVEQLPGQPRNKFLNNYTAFYVPPAPSTIPINTVAFNPFEGFEIDGIGGLVFTPYNGQPPIGPIPYAGIWLNDQDYLETDNSNQNTTMTFSNLNAGIVARRASMYIKRCEFINITGHPFYQNVYSGTTYGTGISTVNGHGLFFLKQTGFGHLPGNPLSFNNVRTGIYASQAITSINYNRMMNMKTGVIATNNNYSITTNVSKNYIHCLFPESPVFGIRALFNQSTNQLDIRENIIDLYADPQEGLSIGIEMQEFNQIPNVAQISNNTVHMRGRTYGISLRSTSSTNVTNNECILYDFTSNLRGISIVQCTRHRIIENYCHGLNNNFASAGTIPTYGIFTIESPRGTYECNTTERLRRGIFFQNFCDQTIFQTNIMGRSSRGLFLFNSIIGDQVDRGNRWPAGPAGYLNGIGAQNNSPGSYFYTPAGLYIFTPNPFPAVGWFYNSNNQPPICHPNEPLPDLTNEDDPTPGDSAIVNEELDYEFEAEEWQNKITVYEKGLENASFINSGSLMQQFFATNDNTSVGQNARIKERLHELISTCDTELNNFNLINAQMISLCSELIYRDSLLYTGSLSPTEIEMIRNEKDSIIAEIKLIISDSKMQEIAFNSCLSTNLGQVRDSASNLSENAVYESNLKQTIQIYTDWRTNGYFSQSDMQMLYFIASQCRPEGGLGVELARGLIRTFDDETVFDDESLCTSSSRLVKNEDDLILNHSVSIPFILLNSGDELQIKITDEFVIPESVQITDIVGRIVKTAIVSSNESMNINLKELAKGSYLVLMKTKNPATIYCQKFIW